jgi:hypothetical protein
LASPLDPVLGPPLFWSGPKIGDPGPSGGPDNRPVAPTYEVLNGSPALQAGNPATSPLTDQRGVARNQAMPNIGAYEATLSQFLLTADPQQYQGSSFNLTVTAADPYGKTVYTYRGTIHFSSSDPLANLPGDANHNYTFTAGDAGVHTFSVTLNTPGQQTITVWDLADPSKMGQETFQVM